MLSATYISKMSRALYPESTWISDVSMERSEINLMMYNGISNRLRSREFDWQAVTDTWHTFWSRILTNCRKSNWLLYVDVTDSFFQLHILIYGYDNKIYYLFLITNTTYNYLAGKLIWHSLILQTKLRSLLHGKRWQSLSLACVKVLHKRKVLNLAFHFT